MRCAAGTYKQLLLARGADPKAPGWSGPLLGEQTPIAKAQDQERADLVAALTEAAERPPVPVIPALPERKWMQQGTAEHELMLASHRGDRASVERMLAERPDLVNAGLRGTVS